LWRAVNLIGQPLADQENRRIFVSGHAEYDPYTLDAEYKRDWTEG